MLHPTCYRLPGRFGSIWSWVGLIFLSLHSIYNVLKLRSTTIFCFQYSSRTQPPLIRHPCLNSGLFEHRVQTLLKSSRISSTSKFQTYRICSRSHRKTNHPHIQMISELPGNSYCSLLFYCPYYTKVITIKILNIWLVASFYCSIGDFSSIWGICSNQPASCSCSIGGVPLIFKFLLQLTCFLLLFDWGFFLYFENLLQPACFLFSLNWGFFLYLGNLLQPTCFLLLFHWGSSPHFQVFAPTDLFPTLVRLGIFSLFREFAPTSLLPALVPLGEFPSFSSFCSN